MSLNMIDVLKAKSDMEVVEALQDGSVIVRAAAICQVVRRRIAGHAVDRKLRELTRDTESFWNRFLICDFAEAALDLLQIEPYQGDKDTVRVLIQSGLNF